MNDNHKIFGMKDNIAYGVCFIVPIVAVIALIVDRAMNMENKQFMWEAVLGMAAAIILGLLTFFIRGALGYVVWLIMIFIGILNLFVSITHLPFISVIAERSPGCSAEPNYSPQGVASLRAFFIAFSGAGEILQEPYIALLDS